MSIADLIGYLDPGFVHSYSTKLSPKTPNFVCGVHLPPFLKHIINLRRRSGPFLNFSGFKLWLFQNLSITSITPGRVHFTLPIEQHHTNRLSILHGGTIASMVNLGGSLAVATCGLYSTVSTDLNVSTSAGDKITAEVQCNKFGKMLAYTSIVIRNAAGETFAR